MIEGPDAERREARKVRQALTRPQSTGAANREGRLVYRLAKAAHIELRRRSS